MQIYLLFLYVFILSLIFINWFIYLQPYLFICSLYSYSFLYILYFFFFSFYIYNGLTNLNRSFTKFNSLNKNRYSIKITSCCPRWLGEIGNRKILWTKKIFDHNQSINKKDCHCWDGQKKWVPKTNKTLHWLVTIASDSQSQLLGVMWWNWNE